MVRTHQDLDVWKKSIELVTLIYRLTNSYPQSELFGLTAQIRRSAVSIPSNIAEGAARTGKVEFKRFLNIALSSAVELETQIIISFNLQFIDSIQKEELLKKLNAIIKMLYGLTKSLDY